MSVHKYTSGGRTRNVVNIADPGGTGAAYSLTAPNSAPTLASDGFKNFHSQETLHILIHNNGLTAAGPSDITVPADSITIYAYNSSLGSKWSQLRIPVRNSGSNGLEFPVAVVPDTIAHDTTYKLVLPIDGAERIAVHASDIGSRAAGSLDIYLGVNTI